MKANELRIGNLINCIVFDEDENGNDLKIESFGKFIGLDPFENFWWVESNLSREFYDEFEPIPLTEEWFIKFGAKSDDFEIESFVLSSLTCDYRFFKRTTMDKNIYWTCEKVLGDTCIEHVHQLQNLYFALTGQELELK